MGRWQNKILKPADALPTKPTEPPFVSSVSTGSGHFQKTVESAIDGLPTVIDEVLASPLFGGKDFNQVEDGSFTQTQIRLYVASWILNDRQFPTQIHPDFEDRLGHLKK